MFGKNAKRQRAVGPMAAPVDRADFIGLDPELQELMLLEEAERAGMPDAMSAPSGGLDPELQELMLLEEAERAEREDH